MEGTLVGVLSFCLETGLKLSTKKYVLLDVNFGIL